MIPLPTSLTTFSPSQSGGGVSRGRAEVETAAGNPPDPGTTGTGVRDRLPDCTVFGIFFDFPKISQNWLAGGQSEEVSDNVTKGAPQERPICTYCHFFSTRCLARETDVFFRPSWAVFGPPRIANYQISRKCSKTKPNVWRSKVKPSQSPTASIHVLQRGLRGSAAVSSVQVPRPRLAPILPPM